MKKWKIALLGFFGLSFLGGIVQSIQESNPAHKKAQRDAVIADAFAKARPNWTVPTDEPTFGMRELGGFGDGGLGAKALGLVSQRLKDPESAKFDNIYAVGDRKTSGKFIVHICGHVNAKNEFGGYVGRRAFLIRLDTLELRLADGSSGPANAVIKDFNAICAGEHTDPTVEQKAAWLEKNGKLPPARP